MQKTKNYNLNKPEPDDYVIVGDWNYNMDEIDKLIKAVNDALDVLSTNGVNLLDLLREKADLDSKGKVLVSQLPDLDVYKDVLMYEARGNFPSTGDVKKLYVDKSGSKIYRWTGSTYVELSPQLKIGKVEDTAFDGARGKALEDEMQKRYTKQEVDEYLRKKVDAVTGKGLSTNDFTDDFKKKIDKLEVKSFSTRWVSVWKYGKIVCVMPNESNCSGVGEIPYGFRPMRVAKQMLGGNYANYQTMDIAEIYPDGKTKGSWLEGVALTYYTSEE